MPFITDMAGDVGGLFVVVSVVAASLAVLRSTTVKQRTQILESTNAALTDRVAFLESEAARLAREAADERAMFTAQLKAMTDKVAVLEALATGREQLEVIVDILGHHGTILRGLERATLGKPQHPNR